MDNEREDLTQQTGEGLNETVAAPENATETAAEAAETVTATETEAEAVLAPMPQKKSNKRLIALIAVAVVVIAAVAAVFSFADANKLVLEAGAKTFALNEGIVAKLINFDSQDSNVTFNGDLAGFKFDGEANCDKTNKQSNVLFNFDFGGAKMGFAGYLDEKVFQLNAPDFCDKVLVYDYTDESKDGYFGELLQQTGMSFEDFDSIFKSAYSEDNNGMEKYIEDLKDVTVKHVKAMKLEKTDAKDFTINGQKTSCKGYKTTLTSDDMKSWIEDYKNVVTAYYKALEQQMNIYRGMAGEYTESFDTIIDELEGASDVEITFYLKAGLLSADQFAAIELYNADAESTLVINFEGGDYPTQNGSLVIRDNDNNETSAFAWSVTTKDDISTCEFKADDELLCSIKYNEKDGKYNLEMQGKEIMNGVLLVTDEQIKFTIDSISDSTVPFKFECVAKKGANKIEKLEGTEFDLCHADADQWSDLIEEVNTKIMSNPALLGMLLGEF